MSKFFGLPGIRLGLAVGKFPSAFKLALGFNPYSLRVAATALAEQVHYARNWASMHEAALQLREEFTSPSLVFYPTEASFQLVRLASDLASGVDVESLAERSGALPKHFHFQGRRYLRWGLGPREVVDRIAAFHRLLEAQVRTA